MVVDGVMRFDGRSAAVGALRAADPRFAAVLDAVGLLELKSAQDPFRALCESIVYQQLSLKAAGTIWHRFEALTPVTPEDIAGLAVEDMRAVGLSGQKSRYLKDLADAVLTRRIDLDGLGALDDEAVIEEVTLVKGIGRWTAEMFLIFSLGRLDVLALDDAGLLRAAGWLLGHQRPATREEFAEAGEAWRPYRSVASLYLWAAKDRGLLD